jgi:hypothetical protein
MQKQFVCTVHIAAEPLWSIVQPRFLRAHLPGAILVAATDEGSAAGADFDVMEVGRGTHRDKLDALADRVVEGLSTSDDDILIFIDGDAFPVRPLLPVISSVLEKARLAAVCREENREDYPHPCFCATTVGFWKKIAGTWQELPDPLEQHELGGGQLRELMKQAGLEWQRLRRSNAFNPHPLMFGLYEGVIYHHGAGFRRPVTAVDRESLNTRFSRETSQWPEIGERLSELVADQNRSLSDVFKRLIQFVPDFHRILELPR